MFTLKIFTAVFLAATVAPEVAATAQAPVKGSFGGGAGVVSTVLKDDFALLEDDFEAPSASLAFAAVFDEKSSEMKPPSDDAGSEKPFLLTLVLDLMILLVVAHGFQRYREETQKPASTALDSVKVVELKEEQCQQKTAKTLAAFNAFARAVQIGDEAACLRLLEKTAADETDDVLPLLRSSDSCGCSALHLAAHEGCLLVLRKLLQLGGDPNAKDSWDETPLHFAARAGQVEACRELIAAGAEMEAKNLSERNVVFVAAEAKQEEVCRFLLEQGATAGDVEDAELPSLFSMLVLERMMLQAVAAPSVTKDAPRL